VYSTHLHLDGVFIIEAPLLSLIDTTKKSCANLSPEQEATVSAVKTSPCHFSLLHTLRMRCNVYS
jgi:hypothetical protein